MGFFSGLDADQYDRQYSDLYLFGRLWDYVKSHQRSVWGIVVMGLLIAFGLSLVPILTAEIVSALEAGNSMDLVVFLMIGLTVAVLSRYFANWVMRRLLANVIGEMIARMRKDAFHAAINRDMAFFDENKTGKLISRITSDTEEFAQVFTFSFQIIAELIQLVFLIGVLLWRSPRLTLYLFGFMPIVLILALLFRWLARGVTRQGTRAMAAVNDNIQESVSGISVAKNFRQEASMYEMFTAVNLLSYRTNLKRGFVLALVFPVFNATAGFAIATLLYFGAQQVLVGAIGLGAWFLFMQATDRYWFPIINLTSYWSQFQQALSDLERIFALIDAENTVNQTGDQSAEGVQGHISFNHVDFSYSGGAPWVLKDFSLDISQGESIALVGHTGAGKSSIIKLITRFYEFQGGDILIDGTNMRDFNLNSYRARLGLVPQAPFLFSGTIRDNIRYGRPDVSDDEIESIAYRIGDGEWLENMPDKLNTLVGERGSQLSMGQRQLVSLMRVLVQKPAIFILDEATASIDPFTETQIQEALDLILKQSTSILIAHRLSTVRSADRIIVLRQGEIIEQGDHDGLMAQNGHYAELYNTYFRHQSLNYVETSRKLLRDEVLKGLED